MGIAIFAAPVLGFGSDPAIAQDLEIAKTDSSVDSLDPGIKLLLREKMAAGNSKFTDDNIVLFLHGATSPSTCDFDRSYRFLGGLAREARLCRLHGRLSQLRRIDQRSGDG
jgi:hypothetical protein